MDNQISDKPAVLEDLRIGQLFPEIEELMQELKSPRKNNIPALLTEVEDIKVFLYEEPEDDIVGFNQLYAIVQAHQSRVVAILISIQREKAYWQQLKHRADRLLRRAKAKLMNGMSPGQRKELRNKELVEAWVSEQAPEVYDMVEVIDNIFEDINLALDIVGTKKDELDNINTNMSRQQRAIELLNGINYPISYRRRTNE